MTRVSINSPKIELNCARLSMPFSETRSKSFSKANRVISLHFYTPLSWSAPESFISETSYWSRLQKIEVLVGLLSPSDSTMYGPPEAIVLLSACDLDSWSDYVLHAVGNTMYNGCMDVPFNCVTWSKPEITTVILVLSKSLCLSTKHYSKAAK